MNMLIKDGLLEHILDSPRAKGINERYNDLAEQRRLQYLSNGPLSGYTTALSSHMEDMDNMANLFGCYFAFSKATNTYELRDVTVLH